MTLETKKVRVLTLPDDDDDDDGTPLEKGTTLCDYERRR